MMEEENEARLWFITHQKVSTQIKNSRSRTLLFFHHNDNFRYSRFFRWNCQTVDEVGVCCCCCGNCKSNILLKTNQNLPFELFLRRDLDVNEDVEFGEKFDISKIEFDFGDAFWLVNFASFSLRNASWIRDSLSLPSMSKCLPLFFSTIFAFFPTMKCFFNNRKARDISVFRTWRLMSRDVCRSDTVDVAPVTLSGKVNWSTIVSAHMHANCHRWDIILGKFMKIQFQNSQNLCKFKSEKRGKKLKIKQINFKRKKSFKIQSKIEKKNIEKKLKDWKISQKKEIQSKN